MSYAVVGVDVIDGIEGVACSDEDIGVGHPIEGGRLATSDLPGEEDGLWSDGLCGLSG